MAKVTKLKVGALLRIPLEDGSFGYGRALQYPYVAFYDCNTKEPSSNIDEIISKPVLFSQAVRLLPDNRWEVIGILPLEGEVAKPVRRFKQNIADYRDCTIFDSTGVVTKANPEECIGIERAAVWDDYHIEGRLLDTFMGRPNEAEMHERVRLGEEW